MIAWFVPELERARIEFLVFVRLFGPGFAGFVLFFALVCFVSLLWPPADWNFWKKPKDNFQVRLSGTGQTYSVISDKIP